MPTPPPIEGDLNAVIVGAVNARIEAEMMKALSGDETISAFVVAALQQTVEVKDRNTYRTTHEPFLRNLLRKAIQEATKEACQRLIAEEMPAIEAEIRKALRRDTKRMAEGLSKSLTDHAARGYGITVDLKLNMPGGD